MEAATSNQFSNEVNITYEDAILETLTFPEELKVWCQNHPEFLKALKVVTSSRFLHLGAVVHYAKERVLGIYSYDYQIKNPMFKQDFIEYSEVSNPTFTLYTAYVRKNGGSSKWVKDIKEFFKKFASFEKGIGLHHLSLKELLSIKGLPIIFKKRAVGVIRKGKELKKNGISKPTQEELRKWYDEVRQLKEQEKWYIHAKIG